MNTIREDREAIAAAIVAMIPTLNVYSRWPNNIEMPAALVKPDRREESTQSGGLSRRYMIEVLVIASDNDETQIELDQYLDEDGTYSIKRVFDNNPTLGGTVPNIIYNGWSDYGGRRSETVVYIGATISVEIWHS